MALYKPPTTVTTMQTPWLAIVKRADPDWGRERHRELQYRFTKRDFYVNQDIDGAYSQFSNPWQQGTTPQPSNPTTPSSTFTLDSSILGGPDVLG